MLSICQQLVIQLRALQLTLDNAHICNLVHFTFYYTTYHVTIQLAMHTYSTVYFFLIG